MARKSKRKGKQKKRASAGAKESPNQKQAAKNPGKREAWNGTGEVPEWFEQSVEQIRQIMDSALTHLLREGKLRWRKPAPARRDKNAVLTTEYKQDVHGILARMMLDNLHTGRLTIEESKELSEFVSNQLDKVETIRDYYKFLFALGEKWMKYYDEPLPVFTEEVDEMTPMPKASPLPDDEKRRKK